MDMTFVRIDSRLVHGQIIEGWVPFLRASRIVVVNDEVASDLFRETVIKMAVPHDIEVLVYSVEEFSKEYTRREDDEVSTIILFSDISDVTKAHKSGFRFARLNIGNAHDDEGKTCCSSSIFLSNEDVLNIMSLIDAGIAVELRCVPKDKSVDFLDVMKKINFFDDHGITKRPC